MIDIQFTIPGNQEDPAGNPIPKIRKTAGQTWKPEVQRYAAWKRYVQECAQPAIIATALDLREQDPRKLLKGERYLKPIADVAEKIYLHIRIHWADETHGDAEGVLGSIADALFVQDKHLAGSFDFDHAPDRKGGVDVQILLISTQNKGRAKPTNNKTMADNEKDPNAPAGEGEGEGTGTAAPAEGESGTAPAGGTGESGSGEAAG